MSNLDQAREWAEKYQRHHVIGPEDEVAAVEVIRGLPDHWIDADKVREVLDRWAENPFPTSDEVAVLNDFEALLTPSLPTLADLIELGNKPEDYQWMQCNVEGRGDDTFVIVVVREFVNKVLLPDGLHEVKGNSQVTPRPDLPKLEWPGSHADTITAESVEDVQAGRVADFEPALPRPEDVPAGEAWIVLCVGKKWVGVRSADYEHAPWSITRLDGMEYRDVDDAEITLVSRLVPEVKP